MKNIIKIDWPFKKKRGITIAPGEMVELNIPIRWRYDRYEATIMAEDGPILLNEKSQCFLEIKGSNVNPIKLQVVPDFKNKELNFIEVLDPNAKFDENDPRIIFTRSDKREINFSFDEYIKRYDEDIEKYDKMIKRRKFIRNIFVSAAVLLAFYNLYRFITTTGNIRYINLFLLFLMVYVIYNISSTYRKLHKNYQELKEKRDEIFEMVKKA